MHRSKIGPLFDHLVRDSHQFIRYSEVERLGGHQIDDQLEAGRLLDGNIGGTCPAQNLVDEFGSAPVLLPAIDAVRHQAAGIGKIPIGIDRGEPKLRRQIDNLPAQSMQGRSFQYGQSGCPGLDGGLDATRELIGRLHLADFETIAADVGGSPQFRQRHGGEWKTRRQDNRDNPNPGGRVPRAAAAVCC